MTAVMSQRPVELVSAKYEYEYVSGDGVPCKMHPGDIFTLVKKSNSDWWYVRKDGDQKGVYLPATYLEEKSKKEKSATKVQPHAPQPQPQGHLIPHAHSNHELNSVAQYRQDGYSALSRQLEERMRNNVVVSKPPSDKTEVPDADYENYKGMRPSRLDINSSRIVRNNTDKPYSPHSPGTSNTPGTSSSQSSLLSPSFPSSQTSTGPAAKDSTGTPPWEEHTDDKGRKYFYNPNTNETTWTRPRPLTPNSPQPASITSPLASNRLPPGWKEETTSSGETVYTHDNSTEKWYSSKNSKGDVYFYSANREHTTWELPKVIPTQLRRQHSEEENHQSQLRSGLRNSRHSGDAVRPTTMYGTGTFGGPIVGQRAAFPTDSNLVLKHLDNDENVRRRFSDLDGNELSPEALAREKEGVLNRAKLEEGRKSTKVKFVNSYAILTGSTLTFYKDQKVAERAGSPVGSPDQSTKLWGAEVEAPKRHSKNKPLQFELHESWQTSGQTLLLQADNDKETYSWYEAITDAIQALGTSHNRHHATLSPDDGDFVFANIGQSSSGVGSQGVGQPKKLGEANIRLTVNSKLMDSKQSRGLYRKERPRSAYDLRVKDISPVQKKIDKPESDFIPVKEKHKITSKLKSFITRRPTIEALKKQGILREENIFGKQLAVLCEKERTLVPSFATKCIAAIDKRGLQVDGIYRVSGNLSMIQKLRFQIDQEKHVDFDQSPYKEDIHVITGSLKLYFRELPEPLLTFGAYDHLISASRLTDTNKKLTMFKEVLKTIPRVNFETLKALVHHLARIAANSQHNRMTAQSVAIVFGPTLMWSEKETFNIAMNMVQQNQCIEFLLNEHQNLF